MTALVSATALDSKTIRLVFDGDLDRTSALSDVRNYDISPDADGKDIIITEVLVPSLDAFDYVDLKIPNATHNADYNVTPNPVGAPQPFTSGSVVVLSTPQTFTAIGASPSILLLLATSSQKFELYFDAPIVDYGSARDIAAWDFDNGLLVTNIDFVGQTHIIFSTTPQTPNVVYALTYSGDLRDYWNNQLPDGTNGALLGYVEPEIPEPAFVLPDIYNFLFDGLRREDAKNGLILKRYFEGFQVVWGATIEIAYRLKRNRDPSAWTGKPLRYLANLLGWSERYRTILDACDDGTMRQLINFSPQFWKERGVPSAEDGLLSLITGARRYTLEWFDIRTILDEMIFGEEHDGFDPWMVGTEEAYQYNLRIVDDGSLDRAVVRAICRLCRPNNERVLITYMLFIERFDVDNDLTQFLVVGDPPIVDNGILELSSGTTQFLEVQTPGFATWTDFVVHWKVKAEAINPASAAVFDLHFHNVGFNAYRVRCSIMPLGLNSTFDLKDHTGATLASATALASQPISTGAYFTYRVHIRRIGASQQISFYIDHLKFLEYNDAADLYQAGSIGLATNTNVELFVDEIEAMRFPHEFDMIEINT